MTDPAKTDDGCEIEIALRRGMKGDSDGIFIEVDGGTVTLRGRVHTWEGHDEAGVAAWCAPGVSSVKNLITIAN